MTQKDNPKVIYVVGDGDDASFWTDLDDLAHDVLDAGYGDETRVFVYELRGVKRLSLQAVIEDLPKETASKSKKKVT